VQNGLLSNLQPGAYDLKVITPEGCESDVQTILIHEAPNKVVTPQVSKYEDCKEIGTENLSSLVKNSFGTLTWYPTQSASIPLSSTLFDKNIAGNSSYWVSQKDANGCESDRVNVTVSIKPDITFDLSPDQIICQGNSTVLRVENRTHGTTVSWNESVSILQNSESAIRVQPADDEEFTATVSNGFCSLSKTTYVTVQTDLDVEVPESLVICGEGGYVELNASGGDAYLWSPTRGLSDPTSPNPTAYVTGTTLYSVLVTTGNCSVTKTVTVKVVPTPIISRITKQVVMKSQWL
jgi:hypothetical protein